MENSKKGLYGYDYVENSMLNPIDFLTQEDLSEKQDTLVSGENIKTINSQSILGNGNLEIVGGEGGGIADAPSDGKKYVRSNGGWVEETTVNTTSFATKEELEGKVDDAEISDMLTKTEASSTYQPKGDYLTEVPAEYVTDTELKGKGYALKSDTYNKTEIDGKIEAITSINMQVVAELPESGETNTIYLIPSTNSGDTNVKDEYIWVEDNWEIIGSTSVDLSNYYNKSEVDTKLNEKLASTTYESDKATFALKSELTNLATKGEVNAKLATETYNADKATFALKSEIEDMATETWVGEQGFLTEHQDISSLATKQEVTEGLAAKQNKGDYATTEQLNSKVDATAIADMLTKTEATSTYAAKTHKHVSADITDLQDKLDAKANTLDLSNYATTASIANFITKDVDNLTNYDTATVAQGKYATKAEVGAKLATETYNSDKETFALKANFWTGTQEQYEGVSSKDPNTFYFITEG